MPGSAWPRAKIITIYIFNYDKTITMIGKISQNVTQNVRPYPYTYKQVGKENMKRYYVEMRIDFNGEIEADSKEHAEELAWTSWGDTSDCDIQYDGVYSIDVEELEEDEEEDE